MTYTLLIIIAILLLATGLQWREIRHLKREVDYYRQTDQLKDDIKESE